MAFLGALLPSAGKCLLRTACTGHDWREGFIQRAGWSHRAGLRLTAPPEKISLCYSYLWTAFRRTCGVQGTVLSCPGRSVTWVTVARKPPLLWSNGCSTSWGFSALLASDSSLLCLVPSISSLAPFSSVKTILFFPGLMLTFIVFVRRSNQEMLAGCSLRPKYFFLKNYYYFYF